jgi:competence protein ComEA
MVKKNLPVCLMIGVFVLFCAGVMLYRSDGQAIYIHADAVSTSAALSAAFAAPPEDITAATVAATPAESTAIIEPAATQATQVTQTTTTAQTADTAPAALININTANAVDLMQIPGIGETLAGRIIDYREKNGDFSSLRELLEVNGIGEVSLSKMLPFITV